MRSLKHFQDMICLWQVLETLGLSIYNSSDHARPLRNKHFIC